MNDEKTMSDEKTISDEKILSEQEALKKVRNLTYITSGIFVAVGLALIIAPVQMNSVLGFLLGAIAFALRPHDTYISNILIKAPGRVGNYKTY